MGNDVLAEWCAKELRLEIDKGKYLVVKPTMEHFRKLKGLQKEAEKGKKFGEEDANSQKELFKDILAITYPDSQFVDDFLDRYEIQFMTALYVAMGWCTKETFEEIKKKASLESVKQADLTALS